MNPVQKASPMSRLRNNKGFTLIEMAIVLVIIGIIIGAVVKGQDLIENAKAKQFASKMKAWEISLNTYYDRKGRLPGDSGKNGIIGSASELAAYTDISTAKAVALPEKAFQLGGSQFYVLAGNDGSKNYLLVCKTPTCAAATPFLPSDAADLIALKFFESYDTSIDGIADATVGTVTGATVVTVAQDTATVSNSYATAVTLRPTTADWISATNPIVALAFRLK